MKYNAYRNKLLTAAVLASLLSVSARGYAFKQAPEFVYYNGKRLRKYSFCPKGRN